MNSTKNKYKFTYLMTAICYSFVTLPLKFIGPHKTTILLLFQCMNAFSVIYHVYINNTSPLGMCVVWPVYLRHSAHVLYPENHVLSNFGAYSTYFINITAINS